MMGTLFIRNQFFHLNHMGNWWKCDGGGLYQTMALPNFSAWHCFYVYILWINIVYQLNVSMRIFTCNHQVMRFWGDGIMITNNNINNHNNNVFFYVFMFWIMSILLTNRNPQKEIFHNCDISVYMASKYWNLKLDTYRWITHRPLSSEGWCGRPTQMWHKQIWLHVLEVCLSLPHQRF